MRPDDRPGGDDERDLIRCPRCAGVVVTVEMRTQLTVFWRCVACGHIFVQRLSPGTAANDPAV
jgi:hypothetical protein